VIIVRKYRVTADFIDKHTGKYHPAGGVYETNDAERVEELRKGGFLGEEGTEPHKGKGKKGHENKRSAAQGDTAKKDRD
jgi:hypothetical protein